MYSRTRPILFCSQGTIVDEYRHSLPDKMDKTCIEMFSIKEGVNRIEYLEISMKLSGIVTKVTAFEIFIDIGAFHDGFVLISKSRFLF